MKGVTIAGTTYTWDTPITSASIVLRKSRETVQRSITIAVGAAALVLFVIFGLNTLVTTSFLNLFTRAFWMTPSFALLCFWSGIFLCLFLFYRAIEIGHQRVVMPKVGDSHLAAAAITEIDDHEPTVHVAPFFHPDALHAVEEAYLTAARLKNPEILPIHLFIGCLTTTDAAMVFARLGLSFEAIKDALGRKLNTLPTGGETELGDIADAVLLTAFVNALKNRRTQVTPVEILLAAYVGDAYLQELLFSKKIERADFENAVQWIRISDELYRRYQQFQKAAARKPKGPVNRAYTSLATPFLDSVSEDLTRAAAYGQLPMLIGRETELNSIFRAIEGGNQSVILVGSHGVGKESVVDGIAEAMVEERVPKILQDKRLVRISLPHIVSGASGSEAEARLLRALREIGMSGNVVTVISDIDQMIGEGLDLSAVLSQELERGYTFVIATTTPEAYTAKVERSLIGQKLIKIAIDEPQTDEAIQILESKIGPMEYKNHVLFTYEALSKIISLTSRYMHDRYLPEKAIEVAQEVALAASKRGEGTRVTGEDVAKIIGEKTKVPVMEVATEEKEKLLHMEERLHGRVIGQDEAVTAIAAALRRARAELRAANRPIANFLFLGPTGVGKTELAKAVSEVYFGSETSMLRFDMSEYQEQSSIQRLIGGAGQGGLLTEAVRQNPFSLVLLDELEKAHPDILNLFLQVMDDGRLTDGAGRTIDFTNVILIATSNAGAQYVEDALTAGTPMEQIKEQLIENELKGIYRPEFLNRFDGIIVFKPLSIDDVVQIAYLMIAKVAERLKAKGITLQASDAAVYELAQKGFDPKFGARPLRRVIQENVDNAIANVLLRGEIGRRDTLILEPGGHITIQKAAEL